MGKGRTVPPRRRKPTATLDLFWTAADKLRGAMDASEYKSTILTLLYLRFLSIEFEQARQQLDEQGVGDADDPAVYAAEGLRWIPPAARWDTLTQQIKDSDTDAVTVLNEAIVALMRSNRDLTDVFPSANGLIGRLDRQRVIELFALFGEDLATAGGQRPPRDVTGELYEYLSTMYYELLPEFARVEGKKGGEFYTPRSVARLLVEMLQPQQGRVYDPCCGSGGLLVQAARFVQVRGGRPTVDLAYYGQEVNQHTWRLARMNLDIHGVVPAGLGRADTLSHDLLPTLTADFVLAHPPFNISDWARNEVDTRWQYGVPPRRNANYAWLQHIAHKLSDQGSAGVVLANGAMSSKSMGEDEIRKAMVEDDLVACIVALPAQLFRTTQIAACAWFLTKDKSPQGARRLADRRGETLFIDARAMGMMVDRAHRVLTDDDLNVIVSTYHAWRGLDPSSEDYRDVPGFCRSAALEEIREQQHNLTPSRYVSTRELAQDSNSGPLQDRVDVLSRELLGLLYQADQIEEEIRQHLDVWR